MSSGRGGPNSRDRVPRDLVGSGAGIEPQAHSHRRGPTIADFRTATNGGRIASGGAVLTDEKRTIHDFNVELAAPR